MNPYDKINAISIAEWFCNIKFNSTASWFSCYAMNNKPLNRGVVLTQRELSSSVKTLEWRAFDMPKNLSEQIEHTAFLQALVDYAKRTSKRGIKDDKLFSSVTNARVTLNKYKNYNVCYNDFKDFCLILNLPFDRYEKYLTSNLKDRIELGNCI
jgi:hypothetical protein